METSIEQVIEDLEQRILEDQRNLTKGNMPHKTNSHFRVLQILKEVKKEYNIGD